MRLPKALDNQTFSRDEQWIFLENVSVNYKKCNGIYTTEWKMLRKKKDVCLCVSVTALRKLSVRLWEHGTTPTQKMVMTTTDYEKTREQKVPKKKRKWQKKRQINKQFMIQNFVYTQLVVFIRIYFFSYVVPFFFNFIDDKRVERAAVRHLKFIIWDVTIFEREKNIGKCK